MTTAAATAPLPAVRLVFGDVEPEEIDDLPPQQHDPDEPGNRVERYACDFWGKSGRNRVRAVPDQLPLPRLRRAAHRAGGDPGQRRHRQDLHPVHTGDAVPGPARPRPLRTADRHLHPGRHGRTPGRGSAARWRPRRRRSPGAPSRRAWRTSPGAPGGRMGGDDCRRLASACRGRSSTSGGDLDHAQLRRPGPGAPSGSRRPRRPDAALRRTSSEIGAGTACADVVATAVTTGALGRRELPSLANLVRATRADLRDPDMDLEAGIPEGGTAAEPAQVRLRGSGTRRGGRTSPRAGGWPPGRWDSTTSS